MTESYSTLVDTHFDGSLHWITTSRIDVRFAGIFKGLRANALRIVTSLVCLLVTGVFGALATIMFEACFATPLSCQTIAAILTTITMVVVMCSWGYLFGTQVALIREPAPQLTYHVDTYYSYTRRQWFSEDKKPVDDDQNSLLIGLYKAADRASSS